MGRTISITKSYLQKWDRWYNDQPYCDKCSISLVNEDKAFRNKNHIYCIPCSEILYHDSTIDINDEELLNFFIEE